MPEIAQKTTMSSRDMSCARFARDASARRRFNLMARRIGGRLPDRLADVLIRMLAAFVFHRT
jgi:hypothetical protein